MFRRYVNPSIFAPMASWCFPVPFCREVSTLLFSFLVNGRVGGLLAFIWLVLRELHASTYRASAGKSLEDAGLIKYTIPCYFIINGMAASVLVHMCRYALQN